ncbi:MAG: hypothetical protein AB7L76_00475 [Burkholderiaceae bacterium]
MSRAPAPSGAKAPAALTRPAIARLAAAAWPALAAFAVAQLLRHAVVEPPAIAHLCDPAPWTGWCALRSVLLLTFITQGIGWVALAVGAYATWRRSAGWAQLALALGSAGLVLYSFEPSALAALLGALVLVRTAPRPGF